MVAGICNHQFCDHVLWSLQSRCSCRRQPTAGLLLLWSHRPPPISWPDFLQRTRRSGTATTTTPTTITATVAATATAAVAAAPHHRHRHHHLCRPVLAPTASGPCNPPSFATASRDGSQRGSHSSPKRTRRGSSRGVRHSREGT